MKLICFRHGETDHNRRDIVQGQTDTLLNSKGDQQARELRDTVQELVDSELDAVYSSDLQRALRTAELACKTYDIETDERLRETDYGDAVGKNMDEFLENHPELNLRNEKSLRQPYPNGESMKDVYDRCVDALEDIISQHDHGDTIAISGHHSSILSLMAYAEQNPRHTLLTESPGNCEVFTLEVSRDGEVEIGERRSPVADE